MNIIKSKLIESLKSVLPIALIVFVLAMTLTPLEPGNMLLFIMGVCFLVLGMSLFTVGAEMSMQTLGSKIGSTVVSTGKLWLIGFVGFIMGIIVTVSEPDLQILATQVTVDSLVLIITVSVGVGVFLMFALLRMVFGISLHILLAVFCAEFFVVGWSRNLSHFNDLVDEALSVFVNVSLSSFK